MTVVAAPGETWGISGPAFLRIFLVAAGALIVAAVLHRLFLFAGRREPRPTRLTPEQTAYLNGGDQLAVYAALGALRAAGALGTGPGRALAATAPMPPGTTPLAQAVYNAAGQGTAARALATHPWVSAALGQLRAELERDGLAVTRQQRRAARLLPLALLGLVALGVLRIAAGIAADKPVLFLMVALPPVAVVALVLLLAVPRQTRAAKSALRDLRLKHRHLAPASSPAYATYGATGAAMGVALFGTASLWAMDPAFAQEADVQRKLADSTTSSSSCGSGGGDSGGGSSCGGGGGGCGGGGCGG